MQPPIKPPADWQEFWRRETEHLCDVLRPPLAGRLPASIFSLQPVPDERLVYLDITEHKDRKFIHPLRFRLSRLDRRLIFDEAQSHWTPALIPVDQELIDDAAANDSSDLLALREAEKGRYKPYPIDKSTNFLRSRTQRRYQLAFPSPLFHHHPLWWQRSPRLGLCYTIENQLGGNLDHGVTERLLMALAMAAGNRILAKRLRLVFNNSYKWPDDTGTKIYYLELDIPRILYHRSVEQADDKSLFVIAKLMFAHHLFFPHSPEVLRLFQRLSEHGCNRVLEMHGWPRMVREIEPTKELVASIDTVVHDLQLLILAIIRWGDPSDQPKLGFDVDYVPILKKLVRDVLALTCGKVPGNLDLGGDRCGILPPPELTQLGSITLPVCRKAIIKDMKGDPTFYFKNLCPLNPRATEPDWNTMTFDQVSFPPNETTQPKFKLNWVGKYIRARLLREFTEENNVAV